MSLCWWERSAIPRLRVVVVVIPVVVPILSLIHRLVDHVRHAGITLFVCVSIVRTDVLLRGLIIPSSAVVQRDAVSGVDEVVESIVFCSIHLLPVAVRRQNNVKVNLSSAFNICSLIMFPTHMHDGKK